MDNVNLLDSLNNLIETANVNPLVSIVILILVLLIIVFVSIIMYKKFNWLQVVYNFLMNHVFRFVKRNYVMFVNFSKRDANFTNVKKEYQEQGCLYFTINSQKYFNKDGTIEVSNLNTIINHQRSKMDNAKKRIKNFNSLIYLGFPHIPLTFLDGNRFGSTDEPLLYEYQGSNSEFLEQGFYELKKKYNTTMELRSSFNPEVAYGHEVAVKIEQSFSISNEAIRDVIEGSKIISFGVTEPERWGITNYAQIDLYQKEFLKLLSQLSDKGVHRVHLFATTPVSLSFSLGRSIEHYHPEIFVYNYNNNIFDWGVNLKTEEVIAL